VKVTRFGDLAQPAHSSVSIGGTPVGGTPSGGGQTIISTGSNTATWQNVVQTITSNSSNILLGPFVNIASGTGLAFAVSSNTLTVATLGVGAHTLLSPTHTDTVSAPPVRGDLIAATSNATWKRLATAGADALTSDRFLGTTPQGDPHWRPRYMGVDRISSSSSNTFTGQTDLAAGGGIALAASSNTITISASTVVPAPAQAVVSELTSGQSPAVGTAGAYARADHTHGTPAGGGGVHNLLSATHPDTTSASVVRGDMIAASSNAAWQRLPTPTADAYTSDRFLGTLNGDVHWRPRYYGVDAITASSSNTFTGQVDLRGGTGVTLAVSSNTVTVSASGAIGPVGYEAQIYAGAPISISDATTSGTVAVGTVYIAPVRVVSTLRLQSVSIRELNASVARSWQWALYRDDGTANAARVATSNGSDAFTPSAASTRTLDVSGAPVTVPPGVYWIAVRNDHASNTLGLAFILAAASFTLVGNRNKTTTLSDPLDISTGWSTTANTPLIVLRGRIAGESTAY